MNYNGSLTMDERLFIHCYYTVLSRREIAEYLHVPLERVKSYLDNRKMRITKEQKAAKASRILSERNRSNQFDDYIKENYLQMYLNEIARKIGKSHTFVDNRMKKLGLILPDEIRQKRMADTLFKKGQISHNKGKKMAPEVYEKVKHTFFKKGNQPHNAKKNGDEVKRRSKGKEYWMIKVPGRTRIVHKHRYLWELHHGSIPKGFNVQFKDGNTLNCVIENLYLIDRSKQVMENFYKPEAVAKRFLKMNDEEIEFAKKHAPEILELKTATRKLKMKLNKIKKNDDK